MGFLSLAFLYLAISYLKKKLWQYSEIRTKLIHQLGGYWLAVFLSTSQLESLIYSYNEAITLQKEMR